jgi:hypothetical protein
VTDKSGMQIQHEAWGGIAIPSCAGRRSH